MGLAYIAASLREEGYKVFILDLNAHRYSKSQVKTFLKNHKFDMYGIGCMIVAYDYAVFLSKIIRKYYPNSLIIAGNSIASSIPEILLNTSKIDIAVIGEGERTVKEIAKRFFENDTDYSSIDGIYFKKNGKIIKNKFREPIEDIDTLPMPSLELFNMNICFQGSYNAYPVGYSYFPICATRGCPFNCTFCYHAYQGYKVRRHSTERIIKEIKLALQKYENILFAFVDDNFTYNKKLVLEFCDALEKEDLNIKWQAASRVNVIDEEFIKRIKECGCVLLGFGIESGSPTILKNIKKNTTVEQAKKALELCKKYGIMSSCSFMIGNQGENYRTAMETYYFIKDVGIEHNFRFFLPIPFPKTEIFEYAKKKGLILNELKLIKSFKIEDHDYLRVNFSEISDKKLLQLKRSLEILLGNEEKNLIKAKLLKIRRKSFFLLPNSKKLSRLISKFNEKYHF